MITVEDDCVTAFNKCSRRPQKAQSAVFDMNQEGTVVNLEHEVEKNADAEAAFSAFAAKFPADQPRFGIHCLAYDMEDGRKKTEICFVKYVPDACTVNARKFAFANAAETVKSKCQPINQEYQINDPADFTYEAFVAQCKGQ